MRINDFINRKKTVEPDDVISRYGSMNEEQLMQELFRVGSASSGANTAQLDDFFSKVSPMLSSEQRERMRELITQLKNS